MKLSVFNICIILALVLPERSLPSPQGIYKDYTLSPTHGFTSRVLSICSCSSDCYDDSQCLAYSVKRTEADDWLCEYFKAGGPTSTLVPSAGTFLRPLRTSIGQLGKDGLFYFSPDEIVKTYDAARQLCKSYPGFHLALIKNDLALQSAWNFSTPYGSGVPFTLIDMWKNDGETEIQHGDGTPVTGEVLQKVVVNNGAPLPPILNFVMYDGVPDDHTLPSNVIAMCQGNFLNIGN